MKLVKATIIIAIFGLAFISCKKDEINSDGIIRGTIADFEEGTVDKIKCFNELEDDLLGESQVSSKGEFSMNLATPICEEIGGSSSVVVSDPTTKTTFGTMYAYKNDTELGMLVKCNITDLLAFTTEGAAIAQFMYADKPCTVKGTENETDGGDYIATTIYDLNLKKGWNEVVQIIDEYVITSSSLKLKTTISTSIPSGLKWRYFSTTQYQVKKSRILKVDFLQTPLFR